MVEPESSEDIVITTQVVDGFQIPGGPKKIACLWPGVLSQSPCRINILICLAAHRVVDLYVNHRIFFAGFCGPAY